MDQTHARLESARLSSPPRLIDLEGSIERPVVRTLIKLFAVERLLSLPEVNRRYLDSLLTRDGETYFSAVLRTLNIGYQVDEEHAMRIPAAGPVVVVANHPFGAIEGVVLGDLLSKTRPDVRLLGNQLLGNIPALRPWLIGVDVFGGSDAVKSNVGSLKACLRWLQQGGVLGTFPAGSVSHLRVREACISDPPWHPSVAALVRRTGATVVPLFFEGRNSMVFQLAGLLHQALRTALIPSELLKRADSQITVRIGKPIPPDRLERYDNDATVINYLRFKTHVLKRQGSPIKPRFSPGRSGGERVVAPVPVAPPVPVTLLAAEIGRLGPDNLLNEQGDYQVFVGTAAEIPKTLEEIGRLREETFRQVSEGTGHALDLDQYDAHYLHLFMWNRAKAELVGSYRIGQVDQLLDRAGVRGLYTSSLFKFKETFLRRLGPALELGRSFIRPGYQRKPTSLALLWRGIGEFLVRHPRYKVLFGPVSISREYQSLSRRLMVEFLAEKRGDEALSALVRAKNPLREKLAREERAMLRGLVRDVDDISTLVAEIEEDNKGMPVLLRHYLRLGARLLSFNVDPLFGDCLDGLIVVDLRQTDARILKRFMGEEGHRRFGATA